MMWEHSEGKKELREALMTGKIPLYARDRDNKPTKPRLLEIYKSFESLASSDYSKFSSRLSALRRSVRKEKGLEEEEVVFIEPEISWGESEAKELLLQALLSGDIPLREKLQRTHGISPDCVYLIPLKSFWDSDRRVLSQR